MFQKFIARDPDTSDEHTYFSSNQRVDSHYVMEILARVTSTTIS